MRVIRTKGSPVHDDLLSIGAFARRSRLSPKALRLYEREGLLVPAFVDQSNGYRRYRASQLRDARLVRMMRRIDMPIASIVALLATPRPDRVGVLERYWAEVESRVVRQRPLVEHLRLTLSEGKDTYPMYTVTTREVPAQLVLTEQVHLTADKLPEWIPAAGTRAHAAVGMAVGSAFIIFHGEVNEESDGPVEMAYPVSEEQAASTELPSRVEPAHREAFVRITKAELAFPDILSAYDAVEAWVAQNGERVSGSPREVYFTDVMAAGDDDPVCDIAFPIA